MSFVFFFPISFPFLSSLPLFLSLAFYYHPFLLLFLIGFFFFVQPSWSLIHDLPTSASQRATRITTVFHHTQLALMSTLCLKDVMKKPAAFDLFQEGGAASRIPTSKLDRHVFFSSSQCSVENLDVILGLCVRWPSEVKLGCLMFLKLTTGGTFQGTCLLPIKTR